MNTSAAPAVTGSLLTSCFTGVPAPQEINCTECGSHIGTVGQGSWMAWSATGIGGMYCSQHCCDKAMLKARANTDTRRAP